MHVIVVCLLLSVRVTSNFSLLKMLLLEFFLSVLVNMSNVIVMCCIQVLSLFSVNVI